MFLILNMVGGHRTTTSKKITGARITKHTHQAVSNGPGRFLLATQIRLRIARACTSGAQVSVDAPRLW